MGGTIAGLGVAASTIGTTPASACESGSGPYYYSDTTKEAGYYFGSYKNTHLTTSLRETDPQAIDGHDYWLVVCRHDSISETEEDSSGDLQNQITKQSLGCQYPEKSQAWIDSDKKPPYYGAKEYVPGDEYSWDDGVRDVSEFLIGEAPFVGTAYGAADLVGDLLSGYSEATDNTDRILRTWDYVGNGNGAKKRASPYVKFDAKLMPGEEMYVDFNAFTTGGYAPDATASMNNIYLYGPDYSPSSVSTMSTQELESAGIERITPARIRRSNPGELGLARTVRRQALEKGKPAYVARGWGAKSKERASDAREPDLYANDDPSTSTC
ncbi:hypothetical protein BRC81_08665 [Halobacteriales archaeon QS_1_68_20]|nr:MAG: hypothetical protein BRC81_08665 [Halobacteriales archaeon QS_1_68_20]